MVCRTCLLSPRGGADPAQLVLWAEKTTAGDPNAAWYLHTLALAHYRAGHLDQAVRYCRESQTAGPKWSGGMPNRLLLAMAYGRQGQRDEARKVLQEIVHGSRGGDASSPPEMHLSDWLALQALYREAEALFGKDELSRLKRE
jgi:hypothetical protein